MEYNQFLPNCPALHRQYINLQLFGQKKISKGYAIHNNIFLANFSYADKFRPGRWINKPNNHNEQAFKPFGGGARFCPGKTLALDEMKSAVIILLQNFHFELAVPPNEVKEVAAFAMQPENLKMRFKALNH